MPAPPQVTLVLDGTRIHDIASFYAEINRLFMPDEDWRLGHSLDALDDLLYGGYGALQGHAQATVVWQGFEASRAALGHAVTREWLTRKLGQPRFDSQRIAAELAALDAGTGPTYFELVLQVFADHPQITLLPA